MIAPRPVGVPDLQLLLEDRVGDDALRLPISIRRDRLVRAAIPIGDRLQLGIGRFVIPEIARPRTHMERDRQPASVRPRERGMAAVGISVAFD